ncbi:MAG: sulfatase-like hydrolase/transferase [Planctomycetota bacterium]
MRRSIPKLCLLLLALASPATFAADPPNVVYIMADELGYYELSCLGNPHIRTPHVDRMAREGIRFTQALAGSSLCAPTRAVLMTGKHSGHTSVRTNGGGTPLRAGEETIASVLKQKGYATGGFGKWGCGGRGSTGVPEEHGFDTFVGYYDQVHAHSYYPPYIVENSAERKLAGNIGGREGETYSHTVIFEEALEFIRKNKDRSFFCYLPVTPPHGMFDIPDEDPAWQIYQDEPWPEDARRYAAMVTMLDRQVGQVFSLLKELALDESTIVFFCGDNGGADYFKSKEHPRGFHGANVHPETGVEFRGRKGNLYEGGLRIPMIARWPGRIEPGRLSDHLWYFADVLPTLAELSGATAPSDIDGLSIVPELIGEEAAGREQEQHEYLYWELGGQTAVRMGSWKAIRPGKDADWELYDLSQDVSETSDLSAKHPEILAKMKAYAEEAHEPVREGTYDDPALHEKDRQAKWGSSRPRQSAAKVHALDSKGLISNADWKIVRASSASEFNGKLPQNAIDGDPRTIWHTRWQGELAEPPHEIVIDLGAEYRVHGIRYLARQDNGWNGSIGQFELFVGGSTDFGEAVLTASFQKVKTSQEATFESTTGRYVKLRILSEVNGGPWASIAELGFVVGEGSRIP